MTLPTPQLFSLTNGVTLGYRAAPEIPNPTLPTLVLLHPFITDSSFFESQFTDPLLGGEAGTKWNMIALDIHGHGNTTGRDKFTFWDTATDLGLMLDELNISSAVICGTSQGGFVATRLALQRPELVSRVIYAGSTLLLETAQSDADIRFLTSDFPNDNSKLVMALQAGFGIDPTSEWATDREREAGEWWISTSKERYSGSEEKEARMTKVIKQLLDRDSIVDRVPELTAQHDILHGDQDIIYNYQIHAEATRDLLAANNLLSSYTLVSGGAHYLSWGGWTEVNSKLVEVMEALYAAVIQ